MSPQIEENIIMKIKSVIFLVLKKLLLISLRFYILFLKIFKVIQHHKDYFLKIFDLITKRTFFWVSFNYGKRRW